MYISLGKFQMSKVALAGLDQGQISLTVLKSRNLVETWYEMHHIAARFIITYYNAKSGLHTILAPFICYLLLLKPTHLAERVVANQYFGRQTHNHT